MLLRPLLALSLGAAAAYQPSAAPRQPRPALRARPVHLLEPPLLDGVSSLLGEAEAVPIDSLLLGEEAVSASMIGGGFALANFFEVEEPKEAGVEEGVPDIYRDSPLRYLGYANECGEAFRPLVPVEVVYFSYFAAVAYILADTLDKGKKGAAAPGANPGLRAGFGAADTFLWQMLASVLFPSFVINRLVTLAISLQAGGTLPEPLNAEFLPTALGLAVIPLVIVPLDVLAHWTLNSSFRRVKSAVTKD